MYSADALNRNRMYQFMPEWIKVLDSPSKSQRSEMVLQRAYQVIFHLDNCTHLRNVASTQLERYTLNIEGEPDIIQVWSPDISNLIVNFLAAVSVLRLLQNETWRMISTAYRLKNSPKSMRDAHKCMLRGIWSQFLPNGVKSMICEYWESAGSKLAAYRDFDQHHDALARLCVLDCKKVGAEGLWIWLPDNPDAKNAKLFSYSNRIDGLDFAISQFLLVHELLHSTSMQWGKFDSFIPQTLRFVPAISHEMGACVSTAICIHDSEGSVCDIIGQDATSRTTIRRFRC